MIDGNSAAHTLLSYQRIEPGMCLYYVWQAYKANGARTDREAPTALLGWERSDGKHRGDRNPPPGVPVWFGHRYDGNTDGDVVISLGNGQIAATDWPSWGVVGTTTIDARENQIGREYLGWTEAIFDAPVHNPPAPPVPPRPKEETMQLHRWNGQHVLGIDQGVVFYVDSPDKIPGLVKRYGPWIEVGNDELTAIILSSGLFWDAFEAVFAGTAPGSAGRYWSREMAEGIAIRDNQTETQKTLNDVLAAAEKFGTTITAEGT